MIVNEVCKRNLLHEGVNYGLGFGFLRKIKPGIFETVNAVSACKDYMNDIVYCEHMKTDIDIHGLTYSHKEIFDSKFSYMAIKILDTTSKVVYLTLEEDKKALEDNYKNIQRLLNWIEDKIDVRHSTIYKANDGYYIVKMPYYWSSQTYLISLYTLLIRLSLQYDGKIDPYVFLDTHKATGANAGIWPMARIKLLLLCMGYKTKQEFTLKQKEGIHNTGILAYNDFSFETSCVNQT